jgi:hypothetical protein
VRAPSKHDTCAPACASCHVCVLLTGMMCDVRFRAHAAPGCPQCRWHRPKRRAHFGTRRHHVHARLQVAGHQPARCYVRGGQRGGQRVAARGDGRVHHLCVVRRCARHARSLPAISDVLCDARMLAQR